MNLKRLGYGFFDIPVLSLQPIVENAIKYGVGDKKAEEPCGFLYGGKETVL